jgi:hypothetical protein
LDLNRSVNPPVPRTTFCRVERLPVFEIAEEEDMFNPLDLEDDKFLSLPLGEVVCASSEVAALKEVPKVTYVYDNSARMLESRSINLFKKPDGTVEEKIESIDKSTYQD